MGPEFFGVCQMVIKYFPSGLVDCHPVVLETTPSNFSFGYNSRIGITFVLEYIQDLR